MLRTKPRVAAGSPYSISRKVLTYCIGLLRTWRLRERRNMDRKHLAFAVVIVAAIIVVAWVVWQRERRKACVSPIPLKHSKARYGKMMKGGLPGDADPCPPPSCAEFASCSTGNLRKRLQSSASRFPDIDQSKIGDALAMKILQGCDGTDAGACADFLPYVCSCGGLSDLCRNAPDPKPEVCKQNPRTPTAAYGINCADIRLTQGPCPCDCDGGGGGCPKLAGNWTMGGHAVVISTKSPTSGNALCDVTIEIAGAGTYSGFIPRDKPNNIFWSFDSTMEPATIDPSLKKITWRDQVYQRE